MHMRPLLRAVARHHAQVPSAASSVGSAEMNRAAGALLRCAQFPPNRVFSPPWSATQPWTGYRQFRAKHLHTTPSSWASNESEPSEKLDEAELARLLEQFEGSDNKEKTKPATLISSPSSPTIKRKSKIEDYDAWHGWDGENDKGPQREPSSGINEVDRYISNVLSDVAKTKAAREKAVEEEQAIKKDRSQLEAKDDLPELDSRKDSKRDISFNGKITGTLGIPEFASPSRPLPDGSENSKTARELKTQMESSKTPTFSKADVAALAKKLQIRLDEEIKRLKVQKEDVKRLLSTRAREFGKDAQVQLGLLGGKVNEVTGYNEIERLKQDVRERG